MPNLRELENALPVGPLKIIALNSAEKLGRNVNDYLVTFRRNMRKTVHDDPAFRGYIENNYLVDASCPRFGSGEGKGELHESVRGTDLYLLVDVCNHSLTYSLNGYTNHMSPDDHYQDLKRMIAAVEGKAKRINVIMPFLYEGRQHKRSGRESLDCAYALTELAEMGVTNFITFDAHDPRVQNATPLCGFDNFTPPYQFMRALLDNVPDLIIDKDHMMVISPDEGALDRTTYFANVLGVNIGMFYKRRDYSVIVNGKNPIVAHEFLGDNIDGKDIVIVDDMISSGDTVLKISSLLKERGAGRIYICSTFGLFTNGLEKFDEAHKAGVFDKLLTTNLIYQSPELLAKDYYISCDMSKYIALIIDTLNHDQSVSYLLNPVDRINRCVSNYMAQYDEK